MIRRYLRVGVRLGILTGVILAIAKVVQSRRAPATDSAAVPRWPSRNRPPTGPKPSTEELLTPTMLETVAERQTEAPPRAVESEPAPAPTPAPAPAPASAPVVAANDVVLAPTPAVEPVGDTSVEQSPAASVEPTLAPPPAEIEAQPEPVPETAKRAPAKTSAAPAKSAPPKKAPTAKKAGAAKKAAKAVKATARAWVEPNGPACPASHPIKAKLTSRLYHLPGMAAYARTRPDRCYRDEASAAADGLTKAKR